MLPLTIRQALESTHEGENAFKVDGKQLDLVYLSRIYLNNRFDYVDMFLK